MNFFKNIRWIGVLLSGILVFSGCDSFEEEQIQEIYSKIEEVGGEVTDEIAEIIQNAADFGNGENYRELLVQEESLIMEENIQGITNLDISIDYSDVEIVKGHGFKLSIYNYKSQIFDGPIYYKIEDGKLIIRQEENKIMNVKRNAYSSGEGQETPRVVITLPENYSFDVVSISAMGDVSAPGLKADEIITDVNYGTVNFNDCTARRASLAVKYGGGTVNNFEAKELEIYSAYSELDFSNDREMDYDSYVMNLDYTDIKISNINVPALNIKGMYGEADLSGIAALILKADASYLDIILNDVIAESVLYTGIYSDVYAENLVSAGMEAKGQYCNFYLQGDIKGKNELDNIYGTIQLDTQQQEKDCYFNLKLSYSEAEIFNKAYNKSVELGRQGADNSFIINSSYCDTAIF